MNKDPYANVAVTLPMMQTFTYRIPGHLAENCTIGMRVLVPFGRRRVTGYIHSTKASCDGIRTKDILRVLDESALFPASELPLFEWISEYYLFPIGEVIKAALPSGLEQRDMACAYLTDKGMESLDRQVLPEQLHAMLAYIHSKKTCAVKRLMAKFEEPGIQSRIKKLEKDDLIGITAVLKKDGPGIKQEKFIRIGADPDQKLRMSRKRLKILDIVREKKEISLTGLKAEVPTAPTLIKPLAAAGYVEIEARQVFRDPLGDPVEPDTPPELNHEQKNVLNAVIKNGEKGFCPYLLFGVTGSGKTEVYMRLVDDALQNGKNAIVLVPEISLISQTERRFRARFGEKIAVIHSALTKGELIDQWRKISLEKVRVAIGARSAIFAPFDNIGMIIVDEEHDTSYKQESGLRYNARDLAVVRARQQNCPVVMGSATPSVQSYQNVISNRFKLLTLEKRVNAYPLPKIVPVDLKKLKDKKGNDRIISPLLAKEIRKCLNDRHQALIFLNRRGYATYPVCRDCGETLSCKHCDVTMTLHRAAGEYRCHLCGYSRDKSVKCPKCGSNKIRPLGYGTQKLEGMLKEMFPDARVARMDQDTTSAKGSLLKMLRDIRNRNVDIIVGTQMLAKGHDFPSITLVGVVCADLSLSLPDFRAGERTFQLLAQVAGRAGRGDQKGRVVMQTYNPDHFIIEAARDQDFTGFFENEVPFRKALMYPPFTRMIQMKISGTQKARTADFSQKVSEVISEILGAYDTTKRQMIQVLGPIEAPIVRISSRFRWQVLIKSVSAGLINQLVRSVMDHPALASKNAVSLSVDVDPYFLM